jgi:hypothetical protein
MFLVSLGNNTARAPGDDSPGGFFASKIRIVTLTKQSDKIPSAPRQGSARDISPEMIDAGVQQFLRDYPETGAGDELDRRMVARIYDAMALSRLQSSPKSECNMRTLSKRRKPTPAR